MVTVSLASPCPECRAVAPTRHVAFSGWFLLRSNVQLRFLRVFSWLDSMFILVLNNIPFMDVPVYLFIQLLKDVLVASKFWKL